MRFHYSLRTTAQRRKPEKCFQFERGWRGEGERPTLSTLSQLWNQKALSCLKGQNQKTLNRPTPFKPAAGADLVKRPTLASGSGRPKKELVQKHRGSHSPGPLPRPSRCVPGSLQGGWERGRVTPPPGAPTPGGGLRTGSDAPAAPARTEKGGDCNAPLPETSVRASSGSDRWPKRPPLIR